MTNYKSYTIHNQQYKWAVHYKGKCIPFKYDPNKMPDDIVEGMADDIIEYIPIEWLGSLHLKEV